MAFVSIFLLKEEGSTYRRSKYKLDLAAALEYQSKQTSNYIKDKRTGIPRCRHLLSRHLCKNILQTYHQ